MGSGASTVKDTLKPLLLSPELMDGSFRLAEDIVFRTSFTDYIKSGAWLDRLSQLIPESLIPSSGTTRRQNEPIARLREYNLEPDRLIAIEASCKSDKFQPSPLGIPMSPTLSASSKSSTGINDGFVELYSGETGSFSQEELLIILFTIVYPIYLSSREYERFVKYGIERGEGVHDDSSGRSGAYQDSRMVLTDRSKRAQELLLGCAAYYDESFLQDYIKETFWLQRVCPIFRDHPLALCFTDTAKAGLPIVFANTAFCRMFGYTEAELLGSHISVLNGAFTETSQLTLMHNNIRSAETVKFSITLQRKSKKPLFDLVAQKAVGSYSISAHFVKSKHTGLELLNMVDDVLILLSYLVKAPALPAKPSWLPAPIVILARSASNALHASPSSARSHSSHSSRSRNNSAGHVSRGRNGKGTPTSVRSIASGAFVVANAHSSSGSGGSHNGSAQNSYRSFRAGGARRHSRSDAAGTPTSYRSAASNGGGVSVVSAASTISGTALHVALDADAAVEFSVSEPTHENSSSGHK